ncbi:MAG: 4Fe-4S dicluster domain-containing protein [Caldilineaceae bacterium]
MGAQLAALREQFPQLRWHQYQPVGLDHVRAGTALAFGRYVNPVYNFAEATRILSLDANFLYTLPGSLTYARQFFDNRRTWLSSEQNASAPEDVASMMNRLYMVESSPTITGAKADHRLSLRASQVEEFARAVAAALEMNVASGATSWTEAQSAWLAAVAGDLMQHRGTSLVIAGEEQPPIVHALAQAMNAQLDNIGRTVIYTEPVEVEPTNELESLRELVAAMAAGEVDTLFIVGSNPVYTAPIDFDFATHLTNVDFTVHNSLYYDETSLFCDWHIPQTHYLEAWSDVLAFEGTATIIQPLIAPLFNSRTAHEVLAALLGEQPLRSAYEIVRQTWDGYYNALAEPAQATSDLFWRTALHDGVVAGTAAPVVEVALDGGLAEALRQPPAPPVAGFELIFRPDPSIWDGQFANNAWLQELPKHLTTLTWDNAALIGVGTAERLGLDSEELVELTFQGRTLPAAVFVLPGHPDDSVTLYLGYGRGGVGAISEDLGFNAYALRPSNALNFGIGLELRTTGDTYPLATVQNHYLMEGREHVRAATLEEFRTNPTFAQETTATAHDLTHNEGVGEHNEITQPSLYPEYEYDGYAWGMAIDLTACIGCNACTIACMVENNIPTVGKEGVLNSREMHWLKVDRYYAGDDLGNPETYFQPRPCMHCEKAPCEPVCPVGATIHDNEGLNQMVYNRCVGTRYCSHNCPYKVRRFNFLDYNDEIPLMQMWRNPEVTVRATGVMEKCTYCVQRIQHGRIEAERKNRTIQDGEILTACQAACPTRAIIFGDINDPQSQVAQLKLQPLNYGLLEEIGTQPRTTYLAVVVNPNPELEV